MSVCLKQCVSLGVLLFVVLIGHVMAMDPASSRSSWALENQTTEATRTQSTEDLKGTGFGNQSDIVLVTSLSGCHCISELHDCACCVRLDIDLVDLHNTVCVNVTYLPEEIGITLRLTFDGQALLDKTISVRNPPPLCIGVPDLKFVLSLCVDLHDLDIKNETFTGCIKLGVKVISLVNEDIELGCFEFGGGVWKILNYVVVAVAAVVVIAILVKVVRCLCRCSGRKGAKGYRHLR